jgi:glutathione synthase/RimK-type ligase-like ATP-grasp enzyme
MLMEPAQRELAYSLQARALQLQQLYRLPAPAGRAAAVRLLAIAAPGDMTANTPLDCLLEGSDVDVTLLYAVPDRPLPAQLPEHDVVFVMMGESEQSRPLLESLEAFAARSPKVVLNRPARIAQLSRDRMSALLGALPGVLMPPTVRVARNVLAQVGRGERAIASVPGLGSFPIIARPLGSHGGKDLVKLDDPGAIAGYLQATPDPELYLSTFVDYREETGWFRKYRIALIEGRPYACHMALSEHWIVHYANAGMFDSAEKRAREERFMLRFEEDFVPRHGAALRAIAEAVGLDYVGVDCAETVEGKLLVFEVDNAMIVHALDPVEIFPYKQPQMRKVFDAFREMLLRASRRLKPLD